MKHMRKVFALALTLIMALALTVPAFAADENATIDVTINSVNNTDATYNAYKLLDLTTALICTNEDAEHKHDTNCYAYSYKLNAKFKNIMMTVTKVTEAAEGKTLDQTVMDALATMDGRTLAENIYDNYIRNANPAIAADATLTQGSAETLKQGYWLIVDASTLVSGEVGSLVMLDTAGQQNVTITAKDDTMSLDKEVSSTSATEGYGEYTDVNIESDYVWFKLTSGQLPEKLAEYSAYTFTINDTMGAGLNYAGDLVVKVGNTTLNTTDYTATGFFAGTGDNGTATIDLSAYITTNKATLANAVVTVTYKAKLNASAVIGNDGNLNTAYLTYTNKPSDPDNGTTVSDSVVVFTYELDATKVAANDSTLKLAGAEFKLYRETADGTKEYVVLENGKVKSWGAETAGTVLTSGANGAFAVPGLDVGTYYLVETKAPEGYNLLAAPVKVDIAATYTSDEAAKVATLKIQVDDEVDKDEKEVWADGNITTGVVTVTIENSTGMELPSTGGIGTTIFYVVGGLLMAGAIILLITKKKLSNEQ